MGESFGGTVREGAGTSVGQADPGDARRAAGGELEGLEGAGWGGKLG